MEIRENTITLADGRSLSYAEYGDVDGEPIFLVHGIPGSRLTWQVMANQPFRPGLRVIAPDRPGYGNSDFFRRGQSIVDYPSDIAQLADSLGIEKFALFGPSGGGPYVLACAWQIPERLEAVGVFASVTPNVPEATVGQSPTVKRLYRFAARFPWLARLQMASNSLLVKWLPRLYVRLIRSEFSEFDHEVYARLGLATAMQADRQESFKGFARGVAYDVTIPGNWPIPLEQISTRVHLWQGEHDISIPPAAARYLADKIPDSVLAMIPDGGHFWVFEHLHEMLDVLVPTDAIAAS